MTVLTELKADPEMANIPVFVITMVDNENKGYSLGASEYLTKPIDRTRIHILMKKYKWGDSGSALVVEDDISTRKMLRRMLEDYGLKVAEAGNGRIALEQVQEKPPGVIFLGLMMTVMDGFEFIEELRKTPGMAVDTHCSHHLQRTHPGRPPSPERGCTKTNRKEIP